MYLSSGMGIQALVLVYLNTQTYFSLGISLAHDQSSLEKWMAFSDVFKCRHVYLVLI